MDAAAREVAGISDALVRLSVGIECAEDLVADVEGALDEPGTSGIAAALSGFWADWQDMGNHAGAGAQGSTLIEQGKLLASRIATGYTAAAAAWSASRSAAAASSSLTRLRKVRTSPWSKPRKLVVNVRLAIVSGVTTKPDDATVRSSSMRGEPTPGDAPGGGGSQATAC
jgi:hypothetical protein